MTMPFNRKSINPDDWLKALKGSGGRITEVQKTLVAILAHSEEPLSAEQVWESARQSRPETGRATVYRTVEKLEALGLLRRVHGYQGCSRFVPAVPESLMLFVCLVCGQALYLDRQPLQSLMVQTERNSGHDISEYRLELFGTCTTCRRITT